MPRKRKPIEQPAAPSELLVSIQFTKAEMEFLSMVIAGTPITTKGANIAQAAKLVLTIQGKLAAKSL